MIKPSEERDLTWIALYTNSTSEKGYIAVRAREASSIHAVCKVTLSSKQRWYSSSYACLICCTCGREWLVWLSCTVSISWQLSRVVALPMRLAPPASGFSNLWIWALSFSKACRIDACKVKLSLQNSLQTASSLLPPPGKPLHGRLHQSVLGMEVTQFFRDVYSMTNGCLKGLTLGLIG